MKKIFSALIVMAVMATAAFATEGVFSVNTSIPLDTTTLKVQQNGASGTTDTKYKSFGIGISSMTMYSKLVGLYADVDFGFMTSFSNASGSASRKEALGDNGFQMSMNWMMGPAFRLLDTDKMLLTVAPGGHFYMFFTKLGSGASNTFFGEIIGLGANVSFSYFFNDSIGITAGTDLAYDFIGLGDYRKEIRSSSGNTTTVSYSHFAFIPKIGVTFKR